MQGIKKDSRKMGIGSSKILTEIPKDEISGTCPLCGTYMPLNKNGFCGDEERCSGPARARIRDIVRQRGGGNIPNMYYKIGDKEFFVFTKLATWKEPELPFKNPDLCQHEDCQEFALPRNTLCHAHHQAENLKKMRVRKSQRNNSQRPKQAKTSSMTHRIKGLDKFKL